MKEISVNNIEKLYYEKLTNGLEVFLIPLNHKKNFYISFNVKYGNSYNSFKVDDKKINVPSGVAHFLEHKLFEREDIIHPFKFFSASGTDVNAGTSIYYTSYYCSGNNKFEENLKYLLNWITKIDITEEKVEKEKGIIIQESRMRGDNPSILIYDKIRANTFQKDFFGKRVIGEEQDILNITKEDLENSYKAFYRPDNMFVAIVGNFDVEDTMNIIKEQLKEFKNPNEKVEKIEAKEPIEVTKKEETIEMDLSMPRIAIDYKMDLNSFKLEKSKVDLYLSMVLKIVFGNTSRFYEEGLKNDLFTDFSYAVETTYDKVCLNFIAVSNKPDELNEKIEKQLKNIKITKEDVERVKKIWIANEIKVLDNIPAMVNGIIYDMVMYGSFNNDTIGDLKNVTLKDIQNISSKLNLKNKAMVKIVPKK